MTQTSRPSRLPKAAATSLAVGGPAVILVQPQLSENIGMVARSMFNCGLSELRLVRPRANWLNDKTRATAVGADPVLDNAKIYQSTSDAVADLHYVLATTARHRDMVKPVLTARQAASELRTRISNDQKCAILYGRESKGLDNDDVTLADGVIVVPLNPAFSSLNLAQAVLLTGYEWFQAGDTSPQIMVPIPKNTRPANKAEMVGLFEHLESELDACGFLRVKEKRPIMVRNLRNLFQRANLTEQEVRTLRGVIKGLTTKWDNLDRD